MFQQLKNIDSAFKYVRMVSVVVIISSAVLSAFCIYLGQSIVSDGARKIYILANGKALEAYAADRKDNIPVEARDHVKMFHQNFFSLDPDEKVIQSNITRALYLADHSAKEQYDALRENGYYANLISGNISQEIRIDTVAININDYPYYFRCVGEQKIIRPTSIVTRSLITDGYLRNVSRSDHNPHGFLIERWKTIENKDLSSQNR